MDIPTREESQGKLHRDYSNARDIIDELYDIVKKQAKQLKHYKNSDFVNHEILETQFDEVKQLKEKLAHYEDNVVAEFKREIKDLTLGDKNQQLKHISFSKMLPAKVPYPLSLKNGFKDSKQYEVIVLKKE